MSSDRAKFNASLEKWDQLREEQMFSVPRDIGKVAIFCSYAVIDLVGNRTYKNGQKDISIFRKEAFAMADRLLANGRHSEIILNAKDMDFDFVLRDESFSDIVTIGHGNISSLILGDNYDSDMLIDWYDLSSYTDHLNTGNFVQRQCGTFGRDLSVPLGMFCVSKHCNVVAPVGVAFEPRGLDHPDNNLLDYVTEHPRLSYKLAKDTFCY